MAVLSVPIILKTMFEAAIADIRRNPWLLDDVFGGLASDPLSYKDYGYKEVAAAKKWFLASNIDVVMQFRVDTPRFPCIAIARQSRVEEVGSRTNIGDDGQIEDFDPKDVAVRPPYIYAPFTPKAYNPATGLVTFPDGTTCDFMVPGQFYVCAKTGKAYQILTIGDDNRSFTIVSGVTADFTGGYVMAAVYLWNLHREITYGKESYLIQTLATSDPAFGEYLHDLAWYILGRYKEAFIEGRGFELSTMSSGALYMDQRFSPQKVFTTDITFSGDNQISWIKFVAPKIQGVKVKFRIADGPKTPPPYQAEVQQQAWQMENDPLPTGEQELDTVDGIGDLDDEEGDDGTYPDTDEDPSGQT